MSDIGVRRRESSCKLVKNVLDFLNAGYALRYYFEVLPLFFISKVLFSSLELLF